MREQKSDRQVCGARIPGMERVSTQWSDSWVALFETRPFQVSPTPEGCPEHRPPHLKVPSVCLPDRKQRSPMEAAGEGGTVPMATEGEAHFS